MNTGSAKATTMLVPTADDGGLEVSSGLFADWQQLTRQANLALLQQQLPVARGGYLQAFRLALQLKAQQPVQDPNLAAFVISLHNLADLAMLEENPDEARTLLGRAYRELWELCRTTPSAFHAGLPHLQLCRRELALFCHNFGPDPASTALLQLAWPASAH